MTIPHPPSGASSAPDVVHAERVERDAPPSRELLLETGLSLARTISLDGVFHEATRQLRRALGCDGVVIALAEEESAPPRLAYRSGVDGDADALERELAPVWREALARARVVRRETARGHELTTPLAPGGRPLGAMSVMAEQAPVPDRGSETEHTLAAIAAQTATAIERAWLVRRVEHKRRLEAIGEVAAGVAHELRNPLFGISSAAQLLRFRVKEDPVVEKNVGRILREVERMNGMVTSLLEYGRPSPVVLAPGNPDAVWDEVLETQRGLLESRAIVLARTRAAPPPTCRIDAAQLGQVFVNVLMNAVDAAPEGTDLALAAQTLPSGGWRCRLHNTGAPIPPAVLPRVFELFFSTKPGGTGIGLALCQRIVEEHGGTIGIESAPEQGTTVTITLPGAEPTGGRG